MNFQEQVKLKQRSNITLKEPMTLDELYALMQERWDTEKYGNFKIEKFLFIKSIRLDDYLAMKFQVQVSGIVGQGKNLLVSITKLDKDSAAHIKASKAMGGREAARIAGLKHWESMCDAMWDILSDKVAEKQLFNV